MLLSEAPAPYPAEAEAGAGSEAMPKVLLLTGPRGSCYCLCSCYCWCSCCCWHSCCCRRSCYYRSSCWNRSKLSTFIAGSASPTQPALSVTGTAGGVSRPDNILLIFLPAAKPTGLGEHFTPPHVRLLQNLKISKKHIST